MGGPQAIYLIVDTGFVVVTHGHDGQHEINEVECAEKDDDHEKDDGIRAANSQHLMVAKIKGTNIPFRLMN